MEVLQQHFRFYSFKEVSPDTRISFTFALAIPLTLVLIMLDPPKVLFAMAAGYAISGPVLTYRQRRKARVTSQPESDTDKQETTKS